MDVEVVLFDGFDELDGVGPYEVLAQAAEFALQLLLAVDERAKVVGVDRVVPFEGAIERVRRRLDEIGGELQHLFGRALAREQFDRAGLGSVADGRDLLLGEIRRRGL